MGEGVAGGKRQSSNKHGRGGGSQGTPCSGLRPAPNPRTGGASGAATNLAGGDRQAGGASSAGALVRGAQLGGDHPLLGTLQVQQACGRGSSSTAGPAFTC